MTDQAERHKNHGCRQTVFGWHQDGGCPDGNQAEQTPAQVIRNHADKHAPADGTEGQRTLRRHLLIAARLVEGSAEAHKGYVPEGDFWHSKEVERGIKAIIKLCTQTIITKDDERNAKVTEAVREIIRAAVHEGIGQTKLYTQADVDRAVARERAETAETILQEVEHTTECLSCGTGAGEHDWQAHKRVIERYLANVTPPHNPTQEKQ